MCIQITSLLYKHYNTLNLDNQDLKRENLDNLRSIKGKPR